MEKVIFDASEIFQFAVRIEEHGEQFYRQAAERTSRPEVRDLFRFLADEEATHRKIFGALLAGIREYQPPETYPDDYFRYLRAYADDIIFTRAAEAELPPGAQTTAAIDFAIRRELDSISYYQEIKVLVAPEQRGRIDQIIEQERFHFTKLSTLRKDVNQGDRK